jgi:hypothetical protein
MSTSTNVVRSGPIILLGPQNWEPWLESKKSEARPFKIWKFVDPSTPKDVLPVLTRLVEPTIDTVRSSRPLPISTPPSGNTRSHSQDLQASLDSTATLLATLSTSAHLAYEADLVRRTEDQKILDRQYKQ